MNRRLANAYALLEDVIEREPRKPLSELQLADLQAAERVINADAGSAEGAESEIVFAFIKTRGLQDDFLKFRESARLKTALENAL